MAVLRKSGRRLKMVEASRKLKAFHYHKEPTEVEVVESEIRALLRQVYNWDKSDIEDLRSAIKDLKAKIGDYEKFDGRNKLDVKWLIRLENALGVHEPLFDFPRGYPLVACDRGGRCLTGPDFDKVEAIETIENKVGKHDKLWEPIDRKRKEMSKISKRRVASSILHVCEPCYESDDPMVKSEHSIQRIRYADRFSCSCGKTCSGACYEVLNG